MSADWQHGPDDEETPSDGFTEEFDAMSEELDADLDLTDTGESEPVPPDARGDEEHGDEGEGQAEGKVEDEDEVEDEGESEGEQAASEDAPPADEVQDEPDPPAGQGGEESPAEPSPQIPGQAQEAEAEPPEPPEPPSQITPVPAAQRVGLTTGVTPVPGVPRAAPAGAAAGAGAGAPSSTRGLLARFIAGSAVIIVSMATATAVSLLLYLSDIAQGLAGGGQLSGVKNELVNVEGGEPQTILILGSDERPDDLEPARADTTILLRIDPEQQQIALLALPRDLRVQIPGHGTDRLNAAYAEGGPRLTLRTVKRLTGLDIHHLVNINFLGFEDAVDALDCVYIDVDRHYLHSNDGLPPELQYAEIDIPAGYQRLCGYRGLNYVRYRHTDNDIVRGARQADFLREARQKMSVRRLIEDRNELIKIFTKHTSSDVDDPRTMLAVLKNFIAAHDGPVNEVQFEGEMGESYVTATKNQIDRAVNNFLGLQSTPGGRRQAAGADAPAQGERRDRSRAQQRQQRQRRAQDAEVPMLDSTEAAKIYANQITTTGRWRELRFPVMMPTRLPPNSQIIDDSRNFRIEGPGGDSIYRGFKFVVRYASGIGVPQYFGLSGTDWEDAPIFERPTETRRIGGRDYMLYYDGDRLRLIAWRQNGAAYWVSNTLLQELSDQQMIAVARGARKFDP